MSLTMFWLRLKAAVLWVKDHLTAVLAVAVGLLLLLLRRKTAEVATTQAASKEQTEKGVLKEQTEEQHEAEKQADDSRSEYERLAGPHRGEG